MKAFLTKTAKYLGYTVFFVVALVTFVYLTLPTDAVRDYLARKASDEYHADLKIESLSTWGLTGMQADGITYTPRPSPDELAQIRDAQQVRKAWLDARKAKAEDEEREKKGEALGGEGGDVDPLTAAVNAAGAKGAGAKAAEAGGDEAAGDGAGNDKKVAADKKGVAAKAKAGADKKEQPEEPPSVPQGPQPLEVASLRARISPFKLLGGVIDGRIEAAMLDGTIEVDFDRNREQVTVNATISGLDLSALGVLRSALPLPLVGGFDGTVAMEIPLTDQGKLRLSSMTGALEVKVSGAAIGPGMIESDKLGAFRVFEVPLVRIAELGGKLLFEKRRATFDNFVINGQDVDGELSGYIQLANDIKRWGPRGYLRFKFSETFLEKNRDVKTMMGGVPYLKQGTDREGYTGFAVTGTLTQPKWRPRKTNPYQTAPTRPRPTKGSAGGAKVEPGRKVPPVRVDRTAKVTPPTDGARKARDLVPPVADDEDPTARRVKALAPPEPEAAEPEGTEEEAPPEPEDTAAVEVEVEGEEKPDAGDKAAVEGEE